MTAATQSSAWPDERASRLEWALFYAACGWRVFPLAPYAKVPTKGSRGYLDATTDADTIRAWWTATPKANIGIATGEASGLVVIDEDPRNGGDADQLHMPPTLTAFSWSGGRHFYYAYAAPLDGDNHGKIAEGIDAKADGGYIVAPPSIVRDRESGMQGVYRWDDTSYAPAPLATRFIKALTREPEPERAPAGETPRTDSDGAYWLAQALERTHAGESDDYGYWLAQQLLVNQVSNAEDVLTEYAARASFDDRRPFTGKDIERWMKSAAKSDIVQGGERAKRQGSKQGKQQPERRVRLVRPDETPAETPPPESTPAPSFRLTEYGNTDRLITTYGERMRWTREFGWVVWDERRWLPNGEMQVREWAKQTVRNLYTEASNLASNAALSNAVETRRALAGHSEDLLKWATRSETDKVTAAMVNLAASARETRGDAFDQQPWLLNVGNGTLDLRTGQLRAPDRADLLTQGTETFYDPDAICPTFEAFLSQIMLGRDELVSYLQRALGYSLTGDVREQVWHLCVGEGANGKSTLFETIEYVLGDYAAMVAPETITLSRLTRDGAAPSPDIARLKGKRFCKITETEEGAKIAPARIKSLTGGDMIMGRMLHRDPIEFRPTLKIWVYTNHRPQVRETTHAFWRRVRYIPFDFKAGENADPSLGERLRAEASGILAWLVRGCLDWQRDGLNPPASLMDATGAYREEQDILRTFLDERCSVHAQANVPAKRLYNAYKEWCEDAGERPQSNTRFGIALGERGFQKTRFNAGYTWFGLGLLDE